MLLKKIFHCALRLVIAKMDRQAQVTRRLSFTGEAFPWLGYSPVSHFVLRVALGTVNRQGWRGVLNNLPARTTDHCG